METTTGMWTIRSHQKQTCLCIQTSIPKCIGFLLANACHNTDGENQSHFSAGISTWRLWRQACIWDLKCFVFTLCLHFYKLVFSINDIRQTWWELQMTTTSAVHFFRVSMLEKESWGVFSYKTNQSSSEIPQKKVTSLGLT